MGTPYQLDHNFTKYKEKQQLKKKTSKYGPAVCNIAKNVLSCGKCSLSGLFSPVHFSKSPDPPLALYDFVYTELCHLQTAYPMVRPS